MIEYLEGPYRQLVHHTHPRQPRQYHSQTPSSAGASMFSCFDALLFAFAVSAIIIKQTLYINISYCIAESFWFRKYKQSGSHEEFTFKMFLRFN